MIPSRSSRPALTDDAHGSVLRTELDRLAAHHIVKVMVWIAAIYGGYTLAHALMLPPPYRAWLIGLALATALANAAGAVAWRHFRPPSRWVHPTGALIAFLVLVNCAVHLALYPEPRHTVNFYLFLLGSGLLILSTPWFAALVAIAWASWGVIVALAPPSQDWMHFGIGFASFTVVMALIHRVHLQQLGRLHILLRRDEEHRRILEQTLEETRAASEAKSRFLAHMSHELRTPLGSIIGFSGLLAKERKGPLNEAQRQFIDRIGDNGRHLLTLIDQVLDLSRLESGRIDLHIDTVDLGELVRELAASLEPQAAGRQLELRQCLPDATVEVQADRDRLRQVVLNLAGNALKFTRQGHIDLIVNSDSEATRLMVTDTGIGIEADDLARIFQPFEQVEHGRDRQFDGAGLGLAISRDLCRQMGFELTADSTPGEGSTFTITF